MDDNSENDHESEKNRFKEEHTVQEALNIILFPEDYKPHEVVLAKSVLTDKGILHSQQELAEMKRKTAIKSEVNSNKFQKTSDELFGRLIKRGLLVSLGLIILIALFTFLLKK